MGNLTKREIIFKQCDNWFSGKAPRPVAVVRREETRVAPAVVAPVVAAPVAAAAGVRPYVFGTVGASRDGVKNTGVNDRDTAFAGQVGVGAQFNQWLGGELFYQGGDKYIFTADNGAEDEVRNHTYGGRLTIGTNVSEKARVFGKVGVVGVKHDDAEFLSGKTQARATAGVGATYDLTENLAVRADYDHTFKRSKDDGEWKGADYLGAGLQYKF